MVQLSFGSTSTTSASSPSAISPLALRPKRRAGLRLVSSAMRLYDSPRFAPSEASAGSRYSVPPKPDLASQMLPSAFFAALVSCLQQAWSLTTQWTFPARSCSQRYSTSSRGLIGGFTFASAPAREFTSSMRCPMVTSRRKSICGKTCCICNAAASALREERCSRLMFGSAASLARYEAMNTANPSEWGGRAA